jgi:nitrogen fixation/metabolism regulation signal transduction histidine kinase
VFFSAGETAEIAVDAREIRKVIYNLVRNGLEAMEKAGALISGHTSAVKLLSWK